MLSVILIYTRVIVISMISYPLAAPWCLGLQLRTNQRLCFWLRALIGLCSITHHWISNKVATNLSFCTLTSWYKTILETSVYYQLHMCLSCIDMSKCVLWKSSFGIYRMHSVNTKLWKTSTKSVWWLLLLTCLRKPGEAIRRLKGGKPGDIQNMYMYVWNNTIINRLEGSFFRITAISI